MPEPLLAICVAFNFNLVELMESQENIGGRLIARGAWEFEKEHGGERSWMREERGKRRSRAECGRREVGEPD